MEQAHQQEEEMGVGSQVVTHTAEGHTAAVQSFQAGLNAGAAAATIDDLQAKPSGSSQFCSIQSKKFSLKQGQVAEPAFVPFFISVWYQEPVCLRESLLGSCITLLVLNTQCMAPECLPPNGKSLKLLDPPHPVKATGRLQPPLQIQLSLEETGPESQKGNGKTGPSTDL